MQLGKHQLLQPVRDVAGDGIESRLGEELAEADVLVLQLVFLVLHLHRSLAPCEAW